MLETNRLVLRPISDSDFPLFYRLHSDPEVIKYCFDPFTESDVKKRIAECWQGEGSILNKRVVFIVRDKLLNIDVGVSGLIYNNGKVEVGYLFLPEYFGKGYGYESLVCVLDFAQSQAIEVLYATVTKGNQGSIQVLKKAGFHHIGEKQQAFNIAGKSVDDIYFKKSLDIKNAG